MNILHVMPSFFPAYYYGGPIESVYQLCRHTAVRGCQVRVLTTDANGPRNVLAVEKGGDIKAADGVRIRYCRRNLSDSISIELLLNLYQYIKWADVVHLTSVYSFPTIPTLLFCRVFGKPVIWSPRGALQRWGGSTRPSLKRIWNFVCDVLCRKASVWLHVTSETEKEESLSALRFVHAAVVANGVTIPVEKKNFSRERAGPRHLLFIGRLHPKKGIENLLEALSRLGAGYDLTICGDGDPGYRRSLDKLVDTLDLNQRVRFAGHVSGDKKGEYFLNADVCLVPSYTENFAMVVVEALAHSVPVIASRGTPWQRLEEIGCGLWVSNDSAGLSAAISNLFQMPLQEMGMRGRSWVEQEYSWDGVAEQMVSVYRQAVGNYRTI